MRNCLNFALEPAGRTADLKLEVMRPNRPVASVKPQAPSSGSLLRSKQQKAILATKVCEAKFVLLVTDLYLPVLAMKTPLPMIEITQAPIICCRKQTGAKLSTTRKTVQQARLRPKSVLKPRIERGPCQKQNQERTGRVARPESVALSFRI